MLQYSKEFHVKVGSLFCSELAFSLGITCFVKEFASNNIPAGFYNLPLGLLFEINK